MELAATSLAEDLDEVRDSHLVVVCLERSGELTPPNWSGLCGSVIAYEYRASEVVHPLAWGEDVRYRHLVVVTLKRAAQSVTRTKERELPPPIIKTQ